MVVQGPQIILEYIRVLWRDTHHCNDLLEFYGVLLHALAWILLEVMPPDPLVLHVPNGIKLCLNECFEILPLSRWRFSLQPRFLCGSPPKSMHGPLFSTEQMRSFSLPRYDGCWNKLPFATTNGSTSEHWSHHGKTRYQLFLSFWIGIDSWHSNWVDFSGFFIHLILHVSPISWSPFWFFLCIWTHVLSKYPQLVS